MKIQKCNRNPFFMADFAYEGVFSDGNRFCLRIPEKDVVQFAETLLKAYVDDKNGDVVVTPPYIAEVGGKRVVVDGYVERKAKSYNVYHCRDCKHCIQGYTTRSAASRGYKTSVCEMKPKIKEWRGCFYSTLQSRKACSMFELRQNND